jgi:hypothetical protein
MRPTDELRSRRFVLAGGGDAARAVLECIDDEPRLVLIDWDGRAAVTIGVFDGVPVLALGDPDFGASVRAEVSAVSASVAIAVEDGPKVDIIAGEQSAVLAIAEPTSPHRRSPSVSLASSRSSIQGGEFQVNGIAERYQFVDHLIAERPIGDLLHHGEVTHLGLQ